MERIVDQIIVSCGRGATTEYDIPQEKVEDSDNATEIEGNDDIESNEDAVKATEQCLAGLRDGMFVYFPIHYVIIKTSDKPPFQGRL